jgi:hypothetical protein
MGGNPMHGDFLKEKQYITNVSPRTLEWYAQALGWWDGDVKKTVIKMSGIWLEAPLHQQLPHGNQPLPALAQWF